MIEADPLAAGGREALSNHSEGKRVHAINEISIVETYECVAPRPMEAFPLASGEKDESLQGSDFCVGFQGMGISYPHPVKALDESLVSPEGGVELEIQSG